MKRITIEELHLRNFRGARDVRVSFTAGTNIVCGDNGTGKSTLMDAFLWVLFGKDAEDRKDCEIKRIEAGKTLRRTKATVECRLSVDGRLHTLRRSFREVWSKPRGATEPVFKGNETEYSINDVPKKMSEFDAWVAEHLAPADVFRLLTDADCFPRLKWEKQREKLFELAGGVDEEAVKASVDGLADLLARLSDKSLEDYKRELAARKRKLRKALEEIPARSDQTRLMIPTTDARDVWERRLADVDARLADLNREAADFAARERARGAEARRRVEEVEALKTRMARRTAELRRAAIEEAEKKNEGRRQVEARLRDLKAADAEATRRLKDAKGEVDELALRINQKEESCERLRAAWYAESARPYTGDNVCPHCLQPLPEEMQRDNRRRFEESKNERLSQIQTDGHRTKAEITRLEEEMKTAEARLDRAAADAFDAEASAEILREELAEMPNRVEPAAVDPMADEAYRAMAEELERLEASEDPCTFVIIEAASNQVVGSFALMRIDPANRVIEVGSITYSDRLKRTRMATEAQLLLAQYVFETLKYRRYEWKCDSLNQPSRNAALRLGFTYEGMFRQAMVYKGRNRDTCWYSMLDSEWPRVKRRLEKWLSDDNFDAEGRQRVALGDIEG